MSEFIEINGTPVEVPADVVSDSRDAVETWYQAQLRAASPSRVSRPSVSPPAPSPASTPAAQPSQE